MEDKILRRGTIMAKKTALLGMLVALAFVLSYIATMFFGVQFESIDKRRLKVIELAEQG